MSPFLQIIDFADLRRLLQCDLRRPVCQKCSVYGVICPGYRADIDLLFHHERPDKTAKKRHRRSSSSKVIDSAIAVRSRRDTDQCSSISIFLNWLAASPRGSSSHTVRSFLPEIYSEVEADHCMVLATSAIVHKHLLLDNSDARVRGLYCIALQATKRMLSSPGAAVTDAGIVTVWLLSLYEVFFLLFSCHSTMSFGLHFFSLTSSRCYQ